MAVLGLRFCARAFSSCGKRGPFFIAVHGSLTVVASLVAEHKLQTRRLSSCGSRAQLLRGMWDLPRPGLEPVSPALAGRFSTTAPPGKPYNSQLFNNLGICCFYAQQYDMTLTSFERALSLAENEEEVAEVWHNLGHVAVGIGDTNLVHQCFRKGLVNSNNHAETYNNLAVLEMWKGHVKHARALHSCKLLHP